MDRSEFYEDGNVPKEPLNSFRDLIWDESSAHALERTSACTLIVPVPSGGESPLKLEVGDIVRHHVCPAMEDNGAIPPGSVVYQLGASDLISIRKVMLRDVTPAEWKASFFFSSARHCQAHFAQRFNVKINAFTLVYVYFMTAIEGYSLGELNAMIRQETLLPAPKAKRRAKRAA